MPVSVSFAGITAGSPQWQVWMDRLNTLERFNGKAFTNPEAGATDVTINFWAERISPLDQAYAALVVRTQLKPYLNAISLEAENNGRIRIEAANEEFFAKKTLG